MEFSPSQIRYAMILCLPPPIEENASPHGLGSALHLRAAVFRL